MTELIPAAVLWDMDGTVVDTEPYWMRAQVEMIESWGGTWSHEDGLQLVGSGLWHSAAIIQGRGVDLSTDEIVDTLTTRVLEDVQVNVPWRPGAQELLTELREAGIPTALVTMSLRRMATQIVSTFPFEAFDVIVAGDDVTHAKPHPAPYLTAAAQLGVDIADCVAIEDSSTGLASAVASGATAIGVPLHVELSEGLGYTIWPSLQGRSIAHLTEVLRARRESAA